jgi:heme exporter protein A
MSAVLAAAARVATVALEARDLAHRYGRRLGLEPVSFVLGGPGVVAITGANGSGKSTLLRIVAGLLRATRGTVTLTMDGCAIAPAARRCWVGYAAPGLSFYDELSVEENLVFAAEARGLDAPAAAAAAAAALARVGLDSRAGDRVPALSSGMMQRLRIAFALLHRPPVLLLDEPGSHMDDQGRATLAGLVEQERRAGLVLIATNDEREWRLAEQRIELRGRGLGHPA